MAVSCSFVANATCGEPTWHEALRCSPRKKVAFIAACRMRVCAPLSASTTSDLSRTALEPLEVSWHVTDDAPGEPLVSTTLAVTMYDPTGTERLVTTVNVVPIWTGWDGIRPICGLNATETPAGPCEPVAPAGP